MKPRENLLAIPCPGCGQPMLAEEGEEWWKTGEWAVVSWECWNDACPYGPRRLEPGELLEAADE